MPQRRPHMLLLLAAITSSAALTGWVLTVSASAAMAPPGVPAATVPDASNAAVIYRRAFAKYHEFARRIPAASWTELAEFEADFSRGPGPEARGMLKRLYPLTALTLSAARRERSDFGIDYASTDAGDEHFADARSLIRVLGSDFLAKVTDGDARGAAEELVAMYRMAGHMAQERVVVGALTGSAMMAFADERMDVAFDHALLGPSEAALVLRELDGFSADDPLGFRAALAHDRTVLADSMTQRYAGEQGLERFRADYRAWYPDDAQAEPALAALTPERLQTMLARFSAVAGQVNEALGDRDPAQGQEELARIERRVERDEFAPLARYFLAIDGRRLRDAMQRASQSLADRRQTLRDIAEGRLDPMALANGAVWYIRATMQWDQIDPDKRRLMNAYALKHDAPADAALVEILNRHDVQALIESVRTAARLDRCDWAYAAGDWPEFFRRYHPGMIGCARILLADAARLFHEQRYGESALRIAIAYRMSGQLGRDGVIAGSLAAHQIFLETDALAAAAIDSRMLDEDQVSLIASQAATLDRGDPFHYSASIARLRRNLEDPIAFMLEGLPEAPRRVGLAQHDAASKLLAGLDADRLLSLAALRADWEPVYERQPQRGGSGEIPRDVALTAAAWSGDADAGASASDKEDVGGAGRPHERRPSASLGGLEAIFDFKALAEARYVAPALTEWARTGQMDMVRTSAFPHIVPARNGAQRARESLDDYRRSMLRFDRLRER